MTNFISLRAAFAAVFVAFLPLFSPAQQFTGRVTDDQQHPIELASLVLRHLPDSAVAGHTYSETDGTFSVTCPDAGRYVLSVQYPGYESWQTNLEGTKKDQKIPDITLKSTSRLLQGVTVTAQSSYIERKADRTIVHVDALPSNGGSSTLEALEKVPGVMLDSDEGLLLKGRAGVQVYMDDKPVMLSGEALTAFLKSLPASNLKSIEVMPNPPAKYDAAGNAGVIHIITKRTRLKGVLGSAAISHNQGYYGRSNTSFNLSLNRRRMSAYTLWSGNIHNSYQALNINRFYLNPDLSPSSAFRQASWIRKNHYALNSKTGLDYDISDKTTVGVAAKAYYMPKQHIVANTSRITDPNENLLNTVTANNFDKGLLANGALTANLRHKIDTSGGMLTCDVDYLYYKTDNDQHFVNQIFNPNQQLEGTDFLNGQLPSNIDIYTMKADLTKNIGSTEYSTGWKSAYTNTDNEAVYSNLVNGVAVPNYNLSNRFLYKEWIHAAYLNAGKTIGKWSLQAGLRGELTSFEGRQTGNPQQPDSTFRRDYASLFPTFYATYTGNAQQTHIWTLSYGRRIDRPYFQDLNPFISPLDKFTFYTGNPGLLPTYAHNVSVSHSYANKFTTSLSYSRTLDGINETLEIKEGIYYSRPNNTAQAGHLSLSVEANYSLKKWWTLSGYAELTRAHYSGQLYTQQLDAKGNYVALQCLNVFKMGKGWAAEVRGNYQSDLVYAQLLIKSYGTLNIALQKSILKGKGVLKLNATDLLYTRRADGIIRYLYLTDADWNSRIDSRAVGMSFSYRFGKTDVQRQGYKSTGAESEQNRVKT